MNIHAWNKMGERSGGGVRRWGGVYFLIQDLTTNLQLCLCHQVNFMLHTYYRPLLTIKERNHFKILSCVHFLTVAFHWLNSMEDIQFNSLSYLCGGMSLIWFTMNVLYVLMEAKHVWASSVHPLGNVFSLTIQSDFKQNINVLLRLLIGQCALSYETTWGHVPLKHPISYLQHHSIGPALQAPRPPGFGVY